MRTLCSPLIKFSQPSWVTAMPSIAEETLKRILQHDKKTFRFDLIKQC